MIRLPTELNEVIDRGGTVIVPSRQRAHAGRLAHAAAKLGSGARVWATPDIMPVEGWLTREVERFAAAAGTEVPRLLSPAEEWLLWRQCAAEATGDLELVNRGALAESLRRASAIAADFGIDVAKLRDLAGTETALLGEVQRAVNDRCRALGATTVAALVGRLGRADNAAPIVFSGFLKLSPRLRPFVSVLHGPAARTVPRALIASDELDELERIAHWCKAQIERKSDARILVTLPGAPGARERLATLIRQAVNPRDWIGDVGAPQASAEGDTPSAVAARAASATEAGAHPSSAEGETLGSAKALAVAPTPSDASAPVPSRALPRSAKPAQSVAPGDSRAPSVVSSRAATDVSSRALRASAHASTDSLVVIEGGGPLARVPAVAHALATLSWLGGNAGDFEAISGWLRAAYWTKPSAAMRARLDLWLRERERMHFDLHDLVGALSAAPSGLRAAANDLSAQVKAAAGALGEGMASPREWSERFRAVLEAFGWPGERARGSGEQQTVVRFYELLDEFGQLASAVHSISRTNAIQWFTELAVRTAFRPADDDAVVTISSMFADPVVEYDGIWIAGLHAEAFPQPVQPDPFLPLAAQLAAGVPAASASGRLSEARALVTAWRAAADELVMSAPARSEDLELLPSPLLAEWLSPSSGGLTPDSSPHAHRLAEAEGGASAAAGVMGGHGGGGGASAAAGVMGGHGGEGGASAAAGVMGGDGGEGRASAAAGVMGGHGGGGGASAAAGVMGGHGGEGRASAAAGAMGGHGAEGGTSPTAGVMAGRDAEGAHGLPVGHGSAWLAARIHRDGMLESFEDGVGLAWPIDRPLPSGTRSLELQNQCPFRAYAELRLGSTALDAPEPGIAPDVRGQLLHAALQRLWMRLGDSRGLAAHSEESLDVVIEQCVDEAADATLSHAPHRNAAPKMPAAQPTAAQLQGDLFDDALGTLGARPTSATSAASVTSLTSAVSATRAAAVAAVALATPSPARSPALARECRRAVRLIRALCKVERERAPFRVESTELDSTLTLAGAQLRVRIDRVDALETGGRAILDYKSGRRTAADWYGERPSHPQLLAYLAALGDDVVAMATINVTAKEVRFDGIANSPNLLPKVKGVEADFGTDPNDAWPHWQRQWLACVEHLATAFIAGRAAVDPKPGACDYCHVASVCRIADRTSDGGTGAEVDAGAQTLEAAHE